MKLIFYVNTESRQNFIAAMGTQFKIVLDIYEQPEYTPLVFCNSIRYKKLNFELMV